MKYLKELLNSKKKVYKDDISSFKDSGLYMLYPDFELKKITNETYLKVGITNEQDGLYGRLKNHFSGSKVKEDIKTLRLRGGTTLHRHMYRDKTLGNEFGLNFTEPKDRQKFLKEHCYFKVLPRNEFNWTEDYSERLLRKSRFRTIEEGIEDILRTEIRYIDDVIER